MERSRPKRWKSESAQEPVEGDYLVPQPDIMAAKESSAAMGEIPIGVSDEAEDMATSKRTKDAENPAPTALPAEVMDSDETAAVPMERALHLRVLAAMLGGQGEEARVEQALRLAQEVYELEIANASLDNYRSAGNAPER
jgi:hypothetical protein